MSRLVYEQTLLTWTNGPQMVGFALAHAYVPFLLSGAFCLLLAHVWLVIALVFVFTRRKFGVRTGVLVSLISITVLTTQLLIWIPYTKWQLALVKAFGPGPRGAEFLAEGAAYGEYRFVETLLEKGVDVNSKSMSGTALSAAALNGHVNVVQFLLARGASVNTREVVLGRTPLMSAAEMGQLEVVKILLAAGADPNMRDKEGRNAADIAKKHGHASIADLLSSKSSVPPTQ